MNKLVLTIVALSLVALLAAGVFAQSVYTSDRAMDLSDVQTSDRTVYLSDDSTTSSGGNSNDQTVEEETWIEPGVITPPSSGGGGSGGGAIPTDRYFKSCKYKWDSYPHIDETFIVTAKVRDSTGKIATDDVKIEVVESVSGGSGSGYHMSGKKLDIHINQPGSGKVAGDVEFRISSAGPNKIGEMSLAFQGEQMGFGFSIPDSMCTMSGGGGGGSTPVPTYVKVKLDPEKQYAKDGTAVYDVTIKDIHPQVAVLCTSNVNCAQPDQREYKYELVFDGKGVKGDFRTETIFLSAGESTTVPVKVWSTGELPVSSGHLRFFTVSAEGKDAKARAKGILVLDDDGTYPHPTPSFFHGEGFIVNYDESEGRIVGFNILNDGGDLTGRMKIGQRNFKLEGTVSNENVEFSIFSPKQNARAGHFEGNIKKFDNFLLLTGDLSTIDGDAIQVWDLTAIGKRKSGIIEIPVEETVEGTITEVSEGDVISVNSVDETVEDEAGTYVNVKKVRKQRTFFGLPKFWNDKKEAVIDVIKPNGETVTKTVRAHQEFKISEKQTLKVGLFDEENVEVSITSK